GRERSEIVIADVRGLNDFFSMTSAEGGWRVAIIDSADELNRNAANALLKTLEEPPARSILILVAHMAGRVLPTIRSRCRQLALTPLADNDVIRILTRQRPELGPADARVLAALADGSPGRALALADADGLALHGRILSLLGGLPEISPQDALQLAEAVGGRGKDAAFEAFAGLLPDILTRIVRFSADGRERVPGEAEAMARISAMTGLDRWIEVWEKSNDLIRQGEALNLDRRQVVLAITNTLAGAVRGVPA
ncbi:MAG: DNA polymerase III subunit delta', partial [Sphingomonadales bacterium]